MNIGKLNKRIAIYKKGKEQDKYGELLDIKVLVHGCWASIKNKSGKEQFQAETPYAKTVTSFLIRYTKTDIDTTMWIEFQGDNYNIVYVDNYSFKNDYIELTAEKVK